MGEIINQKASIQEKSIIKRVRELNDGYFVIETNKTILLTNGKDVYDIKNHKKAKKVLIINNELYLFVYENFTGKLIKLPNQEIIFVERDIYDILIPLESNKYLILLSSGPTSLLFDLTKMRFVCKNVKCKFSYILSDDLFVFEDYNHDDKYNRKIYIFNDREEMVMDCGFSLPYLINGNIVRQIDKEIYINHDFFTDGDKVTVLAQGGALLARPRIYKNNFVIVVDGFIKIVNADIDTIKSIPFDTEREFIDTVVEKDYFIMKVKKDEVIKNVVIHLDKCFVIEHDGIDALPYWEEEVRKTLIGYDKVMAPIKDGLMKTAGYVITFYNEDGKVLFSSDELYTSVDILSSGKDNLFKLTKADENIDVFNIDTLELVSIPWGPNITFSDYGYAFCFNNETGLYDVIDEDLNICFKEIDLNEHDLDSFPSPFLFLLNKLICLIKFLPYNQERIVILDEEGNTYLDSANSVVNIVGNYIEVIEDDNIKYINSITKTISNNSIPALPNNLSSDLTIEGDQIKLNRKNNNEQK